MRLLDRYLLRELLIPFGYCLGGFLILYIAFDMFNELDTFQKNGVGAMGILRFYIAKAPEFLVFPMLPAAWLLALLYALTNHARNHELIAIRAAGINIWRIAAPYFATGLALSLGVFAVNELWVPQAAETADQILSSKTKRTAATRGWDLNVGFVTGNRTWFIERYNSETHQMIRPHVQFAFTNSERLELTAEAGGWTDKGWQFTNVQAWTYVSNSIPVPTTYDTRLMSELPETPDEIEGEIKISQIDRLGTGLKAIRKTQMSISEILDYQQLHPELNAVQGASPETIRKSATLKTKLHGRLAAPWTCLIIVLIALPYGFAMGRRNVFVGVASAVMICFGYFMMMNIALALGVSGSISPVIAAWAPNGLGGIYGLIMTWRVR